MNWINASKEWIFRGISIIISLFFKSRNKNKSKYMKQKAGANSTNVQVAGNIAGNIMVGVSEERVRDIFDEKIQHEFESRSTKAQSVAKEKSSKLQYVIIQRMSEKNLMHAFSDPDFQFLLKDAQKSAATTDRELDFSLLCELLEDRFEKRKDRSAKIGIAQAVRIVPEIPDDALLGLTVLQAVSHLIPTNGGIKEGIIALDNLFSKIIYDKLPTDDRWLDDLSVLGTVRFTSFAGIKKIEQFCTEQLCGYTCEGISENSNDRKEVLEILSDSEINKDELLVKHELHSDYLRLSIVNKVMINNLTIKDTQKQAISDIAKKYCKIDVPHQETINCFMRLWDKKPTLKKLKDWWNSLDKLIEITPVGQALADANVRRCVSKNILSDFIFSNTSPLYGGVRWG
ncbi:hypothetical protein AGMMS49990_02200 [Endomicrobiia bacterium]|nr:hypothetical protein AGMMS49990_02200 [Endomicrobiia bacterium]